jgi:hypothetical protein
MATPAPLRNRAPTRWSLARWVDSLGSVGAALCAVHCALLPVALALLPVMGLGILASSGFEVGFVLFATALATASLWHGYRHHRAYHALLVLVPGLMSLWSGVFVPSWHESAVAHAVTMSIGGTLVALAHLVNMRLSQGHVHEHGHAQARPANRISYSPFIAEIGQADQNAVDFVSVLLEQTGAFLSIRH